MKSLRVVFAATAAVVVLSGCGDEPDNQPRRNTGDTHEQPTTSKPVNPSTQNERGY